MYALFAICNVLSPSRLDDNISNIVKERYSEQLSKMSSRNSEEAIPAFEELFLYACPKFMSANPPPYDDPIALSALLSAEPQPDPAHRHLGLFLSDVRAQAPVPTLRSFLKLYTSLDAKKLANFLDADEESMVQQMMAMKVATRSVSRVGSEKGLLEGTTITTSDLNFVINEVLLHSLSISMRIFIYRRTWFILRNRPSADAMRVGLFGTQNMLKESMTDYVIVPYPPLPKSQCQQRKHRQCHSVLGD